MLKKATRPLGRGSFGVVSLAISQPKDESRHNFPSLMAVKSAESCQQLRSLQKEWKLLGEFADCPHILRSYGTFVSNENGRTLFNIILEYASGGSLADQIRRCSGGIGGGGLSDYEVRWYAKSVLLGLSHIHKQGYVHCDIKPHNILLVGGYGSLSSLRPRRTRVEEETVKIADFGSAKKAGKKGKGGWRGTPLYAAPESVLFQEYEPHSDVWALGCTVLEMITGEPAWKCEPEAESCTVLYRIGFTKRVPEIPSWVTEEGKDFLRKCLVRDPESRWTVDMLLAHPFVSTKVMMLPSMESKRRESWLFQTKQEE